VNIVGVSTSVDVIGVASLVSTAWAARTHQRRERTGGPDIPLTIDGAGR